MSGTIPVPVANMRLFPAAAPLAAVGIVPMLGALVMLHFLRRCNRGGVLATVSVVAVAWLGLLAGGLPPLVDQYKASRVLVQESGVYQPERDIRLGAYNSLQESMVFYAERRIERLAKLEDVIEFLTLPRPGYVFLPEQTWDELREMNLSVPLRETARRYDFYRNTVIVVVTNDPESPVQ